MDPAKTAAGISGCGFADTDSDSDGVADCNGGCPIDATKTVPGQCGCGILDTDDDADGDGVPDNEDPTPTEPGATSGYVEDTIRDLASEEIAALPLDEIVASNGGGGGNGNGNGNGSTNAKITRRSTLVSWTTEAANLVADGDIQGAIDELEKVLRRVDGDTSPPDWLEDGTVKDELRSAVELLIALLQLEL